ncbi:MULTISPECIES: ketose-bisphosphate aldolase [unclassified Actinomyces]|uniref:ketose-bisphosphate aldolase n=1 Tax=unclassified Actinomyces TaxID=2609248 RepID=UPI002017355C|nr:MULTISPECIES: ketose-bisphosphate aldolase [unclassified Actinomyces]MCL3778128.1 ketose-bisphosphate aldolase [Actinomyces sp. AC-20-1]MCL3789405.1 ketose-bisphosphate aldolase [Actinomyces sp. 187325]MCL3791738.1 ketose-bisphosphate aldolase [Actinomyces sp. 186855]MCL3794390.1 ketose-bisphosphate aldolase [Actinomyces sp. 217892]
MLTTGNEILAVAHKHGFAVPAFNISSYSMLHAVVDICEERRSPHIIAIHPDELAHTRADMLSSIIRIAHESSVPTAIHLDHGGSYEQVLWAIQCGFTSVMIDKSFVSFEENVAETRRVVDAAHAVGLSVEAELGTIGVSDQYGETGSEEILYTNPDDAVRFIEATGADSLAIAIGTRHGLYPSEVKPALRLDLLEEIKSRLPIPLVLHGGSNNSDTEIAGAVRGGINKINISSDIKSAYFTRMREVLADVHLREPNVIEPPCEEALKICAAQKIDLFESAGKADLY